MACCLTAVESSWWIWVLMVINITKWSLRGHALFGWAPMAVFLFKSHDDANLRKFRANYLLHWWLLSQRDSKVDYRSVAALPWCGLTQRCRGSAQHDMGEVLAEVTQISIWNCIFSKDSGFPGEDTTLKPLSEWSIHSKLKGNPRIHWVFHCS